MLLCTEGGEHRISIALLIPLFFHLFTHRPPELDSALNRITLALWVEVHAVGMEIEIQVFFTFAESQHPFQLNTLTGHIRK